MKAQISPVSGFQTYLHSPTGKNTPKLAKHDKNDSRNENRFALLSANPEEIVGEILQNFQLWAVNIPEAKKLQ